MKQVRLYGINDLRVDEIDRPTPGPADVLVKVATFGICGSDLHFARRGGLMGGPSGKPIAIGHEVAGIVADIGDAVTDIRIGERVAINPMHGGNFIGVGSDAGAFAEYVLVRNATRGGAIHPLPDGMDFARAVLAEPLAVGMHALYEGEAKADDCVVVLGMGPIGLGVVASLRHRGVSNIVAVDVVAERLERARQLGARYTVNPAQTNLREELARMLGIVRHPMTGRKAVAADLFIDTAGVGALLADVVAMARSRARIVIVAEHKGPVTLDMVEVMTKELVLRGSFCYPDEFAATLDMIERGGIDWAPLVSHVFSFEQFASAFATAQDARQSAKVVVRCTD